MIRLLRRIFTLPALALLLLSLAAAPASALQIKVEGEDFVDYHDDPLSPTLVSVLPVGLAEILQGLDYPGEWVEYTLPVPAYGSYSFSMICWGELYVPYTLYVFFIPDSGGTQQMITVSFTGKGCFT